MRTILRSTVLIGAMLLGSAAYAGDNESPIRGKGPISAVHNEPADPNGYESHGYTVDRINRALEATGQPRLGSARVLYDDNPRTITTMESSNIHIHSSAR